MRRALLALVFVSCFAACGGEPPAPSSPGPVSIVTASSAPPEVVVTPTPMPTPTPTPTASPPPGATPRPTAVPTAKPLAACLASRLAANVTSWEGAAGHQIAAVTLTNTSSGSCTVQGTPEVELVDKHGGILIDSQTDGPGGLPHIAPGSPVFRLAKGGSVTTMVDTVNYCGATPALPTTVAFVLPASAGRLVAAPGPGGGVPPCNSSPGTLGSIAMNGWKK